MAIYFVNGKSYPMAVDKIWKKKLHKKLDDDYQVAWSFAEFWSYWIDYESLIVCLPILFI